MRFCLGICLTMLGLLAVTPAPASYPIGYVSSSGYEYTGNGLWSYGGQTYIRTLYQTPGYWSCGSYVPTSYSYQYQAYTAPAKAAYAPPALPSYTDPAWKTKILDIAAQMDKDQHEHSLYLQSINALGLSRPFNGYGAMPGSIGYGDYRNGSGAYPRGAYSPIGYQMEGSYNFGVNANTQYGYSYSTLAQLYGDNNLSALYQQAAQLASGAQKLSGEATTGFSGLVGQEGNNRARVAEILARGQTAAQVLQALQGPSTNSTFSWKVTPRGDVERIPAPNADPDQVKANQQLFIQVAGQRCAACHSGKTLKGGVDIEKYPQFSEDQKKKVWEVLTSSDDSKRMPRLADGSAGPRLTPQELKAFLMN